VPPEDGEHARPGVGAADAFERLEDREVGHAGAGVLHTLAAAGDQMPGRCGLLEEQLDGRRLADSCLTRHEHDAALAAERALEGFAQRLQGLVTPDHRGTPGVALRGGARCRRRDEPVAPVLAGDEPGCPQVVPEDRAEVADVALDRSAIDDVRGPHRAKDLLLRCDPGALLEEHGQHPGGGASEGQVGAVPGQPTRADLEAERAEVDHPRIRASIPPFHPRHSTRFHRQGTAVPPAAPVPCRP
jgi:hypothetical protein